MRPKSNLNDLPTTCDVVSHLHNEFVKWLAQLKKDIKVSHCLRSSKLTQDLPFFQASPGKISTTADMWTVDTTKAPFLGVTGHWIQVEKAPEEIWTMRSEVIGFRTVSGDHSGKNVGRYHVGVCDRVGITDTDQSKVSTTSVIRL
jgi:hypothetical protein